jgi:hypothetical protein
MHIRDLVPHLMNRDNRWIVNVFRSRLIHQITQQTWQQINKKSRGSQHNFAKRDHGMIFQNFERQSIYRIRLIGID